MQREPHYPNKSFFDIERSNRILRAFADGTPLPTIDVQAPEHPGILYPLLDRFHRYYLSIAWGFQSIGAAINK